MNFTFVSSAVEGIMGYTPEEWVGKNISEFAAQEELEVMSGEVIKALSDPEFKNVSFESKMIHKDGHKVDIIINAKPIYVSGTLVGFQGRTREL
jgi:PAS domain S-box-containing protein